MPIERCNRCVGNPACDNQVVNECLPVPHFGDITKPHLKVVTVGLNPALNEYYHDGVANHRTKRLALLGDYEVESRTDLRDADVDDAKKRREQYFTDVKRDWHSYFEKMESVLNRVNPGWTYVMGSAVHIDLVGCVTKSRWGKLTSESQTALIGNCREHFVATLSGLPSGTVILCDGPRAIREISNSGLRVEFKPTQLINVRETFGADAGCVGELFIGEKKFQVRGWTSQVSHLSAVWRYDLAFWLHGTLFPKATWVGMQAIRTAPDGAKPAANR